MLLCAECVKHSAKRTFKIRVKNREPVPVYAMEMDPQERDSDIGDDSPVVSTMYPLAALSLSSTCLLILNKFHLVQILLNSFVRLLFIYCTYTGVFFFATFCIKKNIKKVLFFLSQYLLIIFLWQILIRQYIAVRFYKGV